MATKKQITVGVGANAQVIELLDDWDDRYTKPSAAEMTTIQDLFADQTLCDLFLKSNPPIKFVEDSETWMGFADGVWSDRCRPVQDIGAFLRKIEPKDIANPKLAEVIHKRLYSTVATQAVIYFATGHEALRINTPQFDPDPMLLGLPGGEVLDLRTQEIRQATRADLITKLIPVSPAERGAKCERWLQYLHEAHAGDEDVIAFLQQWAGLCLTADKRFDILLFLIGRAGAGKGTFLQPLQRLLGPYATEVSETMLLDTTDAARRDNYLADLCGRRLAICGEGSKLRKLDAACLKRLAGGDSITGRRMKEQPITFLPTHKMVISANSEPLIDLDDGVRRRVVVIPFDNVPAKVEPGLREWFCEPAQLSLIFRWALDGLASLLSAGELKIPNRGRERTDKYFENADPLMRWLEDHTGEGPPLTHFYPYSEMFADYSRFYQNENPDDRSGVGTLRIFIAELEKRKPHLTQERRSLGKGERVRGFAGIRPTQQQTTFRGSTV